MLYRILHATHPRTGTAWCIYPSYDYAHGQSDAIEGVTHSICTLEFEDHRPLYDWFLDNLPVPSRPRQYEFARLNMTYTVLSKRVLTELVRGGHVSGLGRSAHADAGRPAPPRRAAGGDPRLRQAHRRRQGQQRGRRRHVRLLGARGAEPARAQRRMAVLRPLKVVIENYPEGQTEELDAVNHPDDPSAGSRKIRFGREIYVERDDFMENPPKKFFRLSPGKEVRLRYAYFVTCREVVKNAAGEVVELRCTYDPATRGGNTPPDGRKVQATLHWVSAADAVPAEVRLYNPLFARPDPDAGDFAADLNPNSLEVLPDARLEPALAAQQRAATPCSSSAWAISAATPTPSPAAPCSTAPSACAIPGPRCRPAGKRLPWGQGRLSRAPRPFSSCRPIAPCAGLGLVASLGCAPGRQADGGAMARVGRALGMPRAERASAASPIRLARPPARGRAGALVPVAAGDVRRRHRALFPAAGRALDACRHAARPWRRWSSTSTLGRGGMASLTTAALLAVALGVAAGKLRTEAMRAPVLERQIGPGGRLRLRRAGRAAPHAAASA